MEFGKAIVIGFATGVGVVLAVAFMRVALHLGVCG